MNKVNILKLSNGLEVAGEYLGESAEGDVILRNPMSVLVNKETGAIKLDKFMLFSDDEMSLFQKTNIVAMNVATNEFIIYYVNNILYFKKIEGPALRDSLREINNTFINILDGSTQDFIEAAKKYKVDISKLNTTRVN